MAIACLRLFTVRPIRSSTSLLPTSHRGRDRFDAERPYFAMFPSLSEIRSLHGVTWTELRP